MSTTKENEIKQYEEKEEYRPFTYGRQKIFIKHIWGTYQKRRWMVFSVFLTLFFVLPWLRMDGRPPILFDIPARKFHIFNITLWPQDIYLLTLTLITAAVGLFFSTALIGRVWCGYLCPQTVFTSIFVEIERFVLGDRGYQLKLSKMPWGPTKIKKLMIRNSIWFVIAFASSFTFLSYFIPNNQIIERITSGNLVGWPMFWLLFITAVSFFDFGFFREQVCFVPCPYGRFQGALQDPNSLVVTYDKEKGEGAEKACIDCKLCELVCPTGIDIRNGAQFECISCARCIDACAVVQIKQKRSPDLIRYASENSMENKPTKIVRPRILIYTGILFLALSFISFQLITRPGFRLEITRNRALMYQQLSENSVSNMYFIKVLNMTNEDQKYTINVKGIDGKIVTGENPIFVPAGGVHDASLTLIADTTNFSEKVKRFTFLLEREDNHKIIEQRSTFLIP